MNIHLDCEQWAIALISEPRIHSGCIDGQTLSVFVKDSHLDLVNANSKEADLDRSKRRSISEVLQGNILGSLWLFSMSFLNDIIPRVYGTWPMSTVEQQQ
jgi:hypothetical protein